MKSADRTLALLEYLIQAQQPRSLREVSEDLNLPKASAYALLLTLQRRGWVETVSNRFTLGLRTLEAAIAAIDLDPVVRQTEHIRYRLISELGETIHLARLDGCEVVYLQSLVAPDRPALLTRPGRRLPAYASALGKAIFAQRPWESVLSLLPPRFDALTPYTVTDAESLHRQVTSAAEQGFSCEREENMPGVVCYAIAVPSEGTAEYAISCSIPTRHLSPALEEKVKSHLLRAADELRPAQVPTLGERTEATGPLEIRGEHDQACAAGLAASSSTPSSSLTDAVSTVAE
ncbi:IclR family transcriptional regulator [Rhodococcus rhodochrous]|uniref:IclR family transcriptional regulator n=1 Tax=Rhodococcus rhodochrous TaxID=1829 RepID=UPI0006C8BD5B|nr:IclR family transcriptional regulator [Rhodococcus rhodochrous]